MKPYGLKRNWNVTEDFAKNGRAYRRKTHRKGVKHFHRTERRVSKMKLKDLIWEDCDG